MGVTIRRAASHGPPFHQKKEGGPCVKSIAEKFHNKRDLVRLVMGPSQYEAHVDEYRIIIRALMAKNKCSPADALLVAVAEVRDHVQGRTDNTELMLLCAAIDIAQEKRYEGTRENAGAEMS